MLYRTRHEEVCHLFILLLLVLAAPVWAQVTTGSISGYVLDPSRNPVPNATVEAASTSTGFVRHATTDSAGFYLLPQLPPAAYNLTTSAPNFRPATQSGLSLEVNAHRRADFVLELGTRRESVAVTATVKRIATESGELGTVLDQVRIQELPLNRRDFLQLSLLTPGVLPAVQNSQLSGRGGFAMHANGGREEFNNYLLDGADNNDQYQNTYGLQPSVDSIQEFKIATNSYSAEYGRSGSGQVNIITRSGTNQWHGTAYEYLRNRDLDARNFFDGATKPEYIRNQFGGGLGGPAWKDHSFFFANFDAIRQRQAWTSLATVPTLEERQAVPPSLVSPVGAKILDLFPLPNLPGTSGNYRAQPISSETTSQFSGRFDHYFSARNLINVRYSYSTQDLTEPSTGVPGFGDYVTNLGHNAMIHYQHIFSARAINSLRLGFNQTFRHINPQNFNLDVGKLWNVGWLNVNPRDLGYPSISVSGYSDIGDSTATPLKRNTDTYQISDSLSLVRGNHGIRFGGEIRNMRMTAFLDYFSRGSLSFSGAITGSGIQDLLMGYPSFAIHSQFDNPQTLRATAYNGYVQDDWKILPRLTLNLGLRYEYNHPPTDPRDRMSIFDLRTGTVVNVGSNGISRSGIQPDRNNFAPRVGFAWSPAEKLAVRGGYGIYYDSGMLVVNSSLYFNPPYFGVYAFFPSQNGLLTLADPFPTQSGILTPASPNTISPDLTTAYIQNWNLNVQRQIDAATVVSVAYAGSKGTHLIRSRDLNQPPPAPGDLTERRPYPAYGGIFFSESGANSEYHSLQASLDRRLARRVSLLIAYTFSKSIDDTSAFLGTVPDKNFPQNSRAYNLERSLSSFHMPHRLSAAYVYQVPGRSWWNRNFEVRGITTVQSGQPFTPLLRFDNSNTGNSGGIFGLDRPNLLRNPRLSSPGPDQWFDTSAFAIPPMYTFGNAGRNILTGPGLFSFDMALSRSFLLREGMALSFDAQAFNLFNRANFDLPDAYADQPTTFGKIFSARAPRQIQFSLRLRF